ncbi:hypothetical protein, partial [Mesorhizobium sp.]|uniref:hypothetical protein n=1 Tax=Mesorhizobium sp. TaxID=1871066 RepID=UPI0025F12518
SSLCAFAHSYRSLAAGDQSINGRAAALPTHPMPISAFFVEESTFLSPPPDRPATESDACRRGPASRAGAALKADAQRQATELPRMSAGFRRQPS